MDAGLALKEMVEGKGVREIKFVSSTFKRAVETAEIARGVLVEGLGGDGGGAVVKGGVKRCTEFRERYFGRLDGLPLPTYAYVWPVDKITTSNKGFDVESVDEVWARASERLVELDKEIGGEGVCLVVAGHADTLQIMQAGRAGLEHLGDFSSYRFKNGECRFMDGVLPPKEDMSAPEKWMKGNGIVE